MTKIISVQSQFVLCILYHTTQVETWLLLAADAQISFSICSKLANFIPYLTA